MNKILPTIATVTLLIGAAAAAAEEPTFSAVDKNRDGYISRDEASMAPDVLKLFATVDANHDDRLSPTEYAAAVKELQS